MWRLRLSNDPFVVDRITFNYTRLIDSNGVFNPSIKVYDAQRLAREVGLNLVCFNKPQKDVMALCKIIDYGKWKYDEEKRKKKEQQVSKKESKEIRFSAGISDNDISHKVKQINELLDEGANITLTMKLFGRERGHMDLAIEKMNKIVALCTHGKEINRKTEGSTIIIRLDRI